MSLSSLMAVPTGAFTRELPYGPPSTGPATRPIDGEDSNWPPTVTADHDKYTGHHTFAEYTADRKRRVQAGVAIGGSIPIASQCARWSELVFGMTRRDEIAERPASLAAGARIRIVRLLRAVPIRWRILSIAALNSAVVIALVALIWNGSKVLGSAWDDVRQVREFDKILAQLESETSRLQNLIHRYINQPSPELFAEILLLREAVLGTLTTRASTDPILSGSVEELERVTERFLNGFGELRTVQATISKTYEEQVQAPARDMAGFIRSSRARPGIATR